MGQIKEAKESVDKDKEAKEEDEEGQESVDEEDEERQSVDKDEEESLNDEETSTKKADTGSNANQLKWKAQTAHGHGETRKVTFLKSESKAQTIQEIQKVTQTFKTGSAKSPCQQLEESF